MTETRMIEVVGKTGTRTVDATIYGQLAVHPSLVDGGELNTERSTITHIATGKALRNGICNETVVGYAERLMTFDWDAYAAAGFPASNVWFGERFSELKAILIDIDNACDCDEDETYE